jgi:hypothetical protein
MQMQEFVTETHIDDLGNPTIVVVPMTISNSRSTPTSQSDIINCRVLNASEKVNTDVVDTRLVNAQTIETDIQNATNIHSDNIVSTLITSDQLFLTDKVTTSRLLFDDKLRVYLGQHNVNSPFNVEGAQQNNALLKLSELAGGDLWFQIHAQEAMFTVPVKILRTLLDPTYEGVMLNVDGPIEISGKTIKVENDTLIYHDGSDIVQIGHVSPCIKLNGDIESSFGGDVIFKVSPVNALIKSPIIELQSGETQLIETKVGETTIFTPLICDDITTQEINSDHSAIEFVHESLSPNSSFNVGQSLLSQAISFKVAGNPQVGNGIDNYEIVKMNATTVDIGSKLRVGVPIMYGSDGSLELGRDDTDVVVAEFQGKITTYEGTGGKKSSTLSHYCLSKEEITWENYENRLVVFNGDALFFNHETGLVHTTYGSLSNKHALSSVSLSQNAYQLIAGVVGQKITPDDGIFVTETNGVVARSRIDTTDTLLDVHCSGDMMLWTVVDSDTNKLITSEMLNGQWEFWRNTTYEKNVFVNANDTTVGIQFFVNEMIIDVQTLNSRILALENVIEQLTT